MLYHASPAPGLKTLLPRTSTHGKAYVYAIRGRATALLFGAEKDDFDLLMDEENGCPVVWECWPGALQKIYGGKKCSLYAVAESGFLAGQTGWEPELVCETPAQVLGEELVPDLYACLLRARDAGECSIHFYSDDAAYQAFLREEIGERVSAFGLTKEQMEADARFTRWFLPLLGQ